MGTILAGGNEIFNIVIFLLVTRQSAVLSFATQYAMPPESGGKWGTEVS